MPTSSRREAVQDASLEIAVRAIIHHHQTTMNNVTPITHLIIHCTATPEGRDVTLKDVDRWHRQLGWNGCGYHYLITLDGRIHPARPLYQAGAHCRGYNTHSIGIAYVGGVERDGRTPKDTRTAAQRQSLSTLVKGLHRLFPQARLVGHHDLNPNKACPCFNVSRLLTE